MQTGERKKTIRMKKLLSLLCLLFTLALLPVPEASAKKKTEPAPTDRHVWVEMLRQMAEPVLTPMSEGRLQETMQLELSPTWDGRNSKVGYMECFGRLMAGIAPWLALPDDDTPEGKLRSRLRSEALKSYAHAVDPDSKDYLLWHSESQTLVDAAFIAESFLRAYDALWMPLSETTKQRYLAEFTQLRRVNPPYNNWLLFSAIVETFLQKAGAPADEYRISTALRQIDRWYVGDGWYSDGDKFAFDYYNSFVIQPMYVECLATLRRTAEYEEAVRRMQRLGVILERFISPEGTFPVFGRSITYRTASLQALSMLVWQNHLPAELPGGQVRAALTAVMKRMYGGSQNYNPAGFLTLGFNGRQPDISDYYTNNGSLYMASLVFLPLGLPADAPFWTDAPRAWTSKRAWEGDEFPRDHKLE
jgi:hypothetical protein